jgi:RHS repeat-associated protein
VRTPFRGFRALSALLALAVVTLGQAATSTPAGAVGGGIGFVHDADGRLRAVVDPVNGAAIYSYDAAGNITTIGRQSATTVSVLEFFPTKGPVGSSVSIYGTGFSSTASQNTVKFNGMVATVSSATSTRIVAAVPTGASTGSISVTSPNGTGTSAATFTVGPSSGPTITGFTPAIGAPGDAVTLNGTNLETSPITNLVAFNGTRAQVSSATATALGVVVPSATSGHVTVRTPNGEATSSADFFVPPSPYIAADVGFTGRMSTGGSMPVALGTANTIGMTLFDGSAGQRVSLNLTNGSIGTSSCCAMKVSIVNPNGSNLVNPTYVGNTGGFIDTVTLPTTGTYAIFVDPQGTATGSVTLTLYDVPADPTPSITPGGAPVTVTTTVPGQNARPTFVGTSGQRVSLNITNGTFGTNTCCAIKVSIQNPDGSNLVSPTYQGYSGGFIDTVTLPTTGTYTIVVDPQGTTTGSGTLTLSDVPADPAPSMTPGGAAATVTVTTPGQNARPTFTGTAGQRVSLNLTNGSIGTSSCCAMKVSIVNPNGSNLVNPTYVGNTGGFIDTVTLPTTGTYAIFVDPQGTATGSVTLTLYDVPADASGTITIGGPSVTTSVAIPGQNARLTFTGTTGQKISLNLSSITIGTSTCCSLKVSIQNPDGSNAVNPTYKGTSGGSVTATLAQTGTHTIVIDPQDAATGSATLTLIQTAAAAKAAHRTKAEPAAGAAARALTRGSTGPASSARRRVDRARPTVPADALVFRPPLPSQWVPSAGNANGANWRTSWPSSPWERVALPSARPGLTAVAGRVLLLEGTPLPGVTLSIGRRSVRSDATGAFLLVDVPAGAQVLVIDGTTANTSTARYGVFETRVDLARGWTTVLPYRIWMPRLDTKHAVHVDSPTTRQVVLTTPRIPGLEVHIPAGTTIRDRQGRIVHTLSITPIPVDRPPFPLPSFVEVPVYFTVQPGGSVLIPEGARLIYPNFTHQPPGARVEFWNYEPEDDGWYIYGHGTVTRDGRQVVPDRGVSVYEFTGAMINDGNTPPNKGPNCSWWKALLGLCGAGDPVDPSTGLLTLQKTDLSLPGQLPIEVSRVYRQDDTNSRAFGIGANWTYGMFLWSANQYQEADLVFPDGAKLHYVRISPGTSWTDAVFETTASPGPFYKSQIVWNGNGWNLTRKDGLVLVFGENAPLQSIRDRYGNQITLTRTSGQSGNVTKVSSSSGRWITLTYDAGNRITQVKDNGGRTVSYTYDANGRLTQVTDPTGGVTKYTWGACPGTTCNQLLTVTDPRNVVVLTNTYDASNRIATQKLADGTSQYSFVYTTNAGAITQADVTDPRGFVRRLAFSSDGYVATDTRALGKAEQQTVSYNRQAGTGLLLDETDALGRKTAYQYDGSGNLTSVTRMAGTPQARTTTYTYDPVSQGIASITDPLGHAASATFDARGSVTGATDALGHGWTFTHDAAGNLLTARDALGNTTSFAYDQGDLVSITDPLGHVTSQFVDSVGRTISIKDALGRITRRDMDAAGRVTKVTDPLGNATIVTYDAAGHLLTLKDPRGNTTTYTYNSFGYVASRKDPALKTESYTWDALGNLTKIVDRIGKTHVFGYDGLGRRTFAGFDQGKGTPPSYAGGTVTYTYDAGDRITRAVDTVGGTIDQTYDDFDHPTSQAGPQGTITYTYDAAGRRATMTVPGQMQVSYAYDNADRLTSITRGSSVVSFGYDNADRPTSVTLANGVVQSYGYDAASRLTSITYGNGATTLGDLAYDYDEANQVIGQSGTWARTGLPAAVSTTTYNAVNRLTKWGASTLTYDANGNLTSDGTRTYVWNARGQLASISGGATASFVYDAFGRRTKRTVGGATTQYLYDGWDPVQELDATNAATANLLTGLGIDQRFMRTDASGTRHLLTDALRSTAALTDAAATVQNAYTYEPYGAATVTGTTSSSYQFTGRENDATGLMQFRARYYSPTYGRFVSEDPLASPLVGGSNVIAQGNLYWYANDDPTRNIDPLGLATGGVCLSGSVTIFHVHVGGSACVQASTSGQVGITVTGGGGVGTSGGFGGSADVGVQVSNAKYIEDLGGPFGQVGGSGGGGLSGSGDVFAGPGHCGQPVVGADGGVGVGGGAEAHAGGTYTVPIPILGPRAGSC